VPTHSAASWSVAAIRLRTRSLSGPAAARRILKLSNWTSWSSLAGENTAQPDRPHARQYTPAGTGSRPAVGPESFTA
jgi:hypothetical protein